MMELAQPLTPEEAVTDNDLRYFAQLKRNWSQGHFADVDARRLGMLLPHMASELLALRVILRTGAQQRDSATDEETQLDRIEELSRHLVDSIATVEAVLTDAQRGIDNLQNSDKQR